MVPRRDLSRAKFKIRKATKWRRKTRKKHNQDQITLTCTCKHVQINSDQIEIMAQDCATHSLESTILVMRNELDDNDIEAGRQMIQDIPGNLLRSKRTPEFTEEKTARILEMQQHENLQDIKLRIKGEIRDPEPQAGAVLPEHFKIYYRNCDAFAINSKDILF
jgi:hypothetical protein